MLKKLVLSTAIIVTMVASSLATANEVNVYSHRHYDTDKQLFKKFEQQTGIKVNVVKAKAKELIKRIESEGKNTPADIFMTVDAGNLALAQQKGLLQPITSEFLTRTIPKNLRQKDGYWFGLTKRARVIVYNKNKVSADELSTYANLTSDEWHERILVRKSNNIYNQSLLASFIASDGEETAKNWAKGIVNNMARSPAGNDRDQMRAVAAGVGDIAIVNTYYVGQLLNSNKRGEVKVGEKMGIFFPNQGVGERGTHINISGAGVIKYSRNKDNAVKFLEFLAGVEAQELFAEANFEYPVNTAVEPSELLKSWGTFRYDTTSLELLGVYNAKAVKVFNRVGWK